MPYHLDRCIYVGLMYFDAWTDDLNHIMNKFHLVSGVFFYMNCVCNPFLYGLFSTRFRNGFKKILQKFLCTISSRSSASSQTSPTNVESQVNLEIKDDNTEKNETRRFNTNFITISGGDDNIGDFIANAEITKVDMFVIYKKAEDCVSFGNIV